MTKGLNKNWIPRIWMGASQVFYTLAIIWNFSTQAGYDLLIYVTGFILAILYIITGGLLK